MVKKVEAAATAVATTTLPGYLAAIKQDASLADAMVAKTKISRISFRGGKIRLVRGGEESAPMLDVDVIILDVTPERGRFARTFYASTFDGENAAPDCSSADGITPDAWVKSRQSDRCASCQKSVFGSATGRGGAKATACKSSKHLWVALADDPSGDVFLVNVTYISLENLTKLSTDLAATGAPIPAAIVKLSLADESSVPQITFQHVGWLEETLGVQAIERSQTKDWRIEPAAGQALEAPKPAQALSAPVKTANVTDVEPNKPNLGTTLEQHGW